MAIFSGWAAAWLLRLKKAKTSLAAITATTIAIITRITTDSPLGDKT
jgi:hypothetical protein